MGENVEEAVNRLLDIVADNVRRLMSADKRLPGKNRPNELHLATGIAKSTIQRILKGSAASEKDDAPNAAKIDTLMRLAFYFRFPVARLLVAHKNDPMSRVFDTREEDLGEAEVSPSPELKRRRR